MSRRSHHIRTAALAEEAIYRPTFPPITASMISSGSAASGSVLTANGSGGSSFQPPFAISPRGLTLNLNADFGTYISGGNVLQWYNQWPSLNGPWLADPTGVLFNASGFAGLATLDWNEAVATPFQSTHFSNFQNTTAYVAAQEFSIGVVLQYTGTKNFDAAQVCPQIVTSYDAANPRANFGLSCGLNSGDPTKVIFSIYVSDTDGGGPVKLAQSPSEVKAAQYYVLATFKGGILNLYVNGVLVATTSGVGNMTPGALLNPICLGADQVSTSTYLGAHVRAIHVWNCGLNALELAQDLLYMKAEAGL